MFHLTTRRRNGFFKNVFFISRGIYRKRKKIIMGKTIRLTESEFISLVKKVLNESGKMTISEADGGWNAQLGKQMGDPSWLVYPAGQLPTTVVSKFNTPNYTQQYTYMAADTGHDFAIIMPANTQWRRTPSGYFLIGSGMKVVGGDFAVKVRGFGRLKAKYQRYLTHSDVATVEAIHVYPGTRVQKDTVILSLANPAQAQRLSVARLELARQKAQLNEQRINQKSIKTTYGERGIFAVQKVISNFRG